MRRSYFFQLLVNLGKKFRYYFAVQSLNTVEILPSSTCCFPPKNFPSFIIFTSCDTNSNLSVCHLTESSHDPSSG